MLIIKGIQIEILVKFIIILFYLCEQVGVALLLPFLVPFVEMNTMGDQALNVCQRITAFYTAPITKFATYMVGFLFFCLSVCMLVVGFVCQSFCELFCYACFSSEITHGHETSHNYWSLVEN